MKPAAAAELLRPAVLELDRIAKRIEAEVTELEKQVAEAVFRLTDDVRKAGHEIRGLRAPIGMMLDELDRLIPRRSDDKGTA